MKTTGGGSEEDDESVLTIACARDPDGFRIVFDRYGKPILSFIYNLLGDRPWAEELMQETFVRAYRKIASAGDETQFSTWLFGIARNVVREAIKEKYKKQAHIGLDERVSKEIMDPRTRPDESVIAGELHRAIRDALRSLREDHRLVFVLKVFNKLRYEEIAKITGFSVGKVKTDLHRARKEMRHKLRAYGQEPLPGL